MKCSTRLMKSMTTSWVSVPRSSGSRMSTSRVRSTSTEPIRLWRSAVSLGDVHAGIVGTSEPRTRRRLVPRGSAMRLVRPVFGGRMRYDEALAWSAICLSISTKKSVEIDLGRDPFRKMNVLWRLDQEASEIIQAPATYRGTFGGYPWEVLVLE